MSGMLLTASSGGFDNVLASMDVVMTFGTKLLTLCMDNPLLSFLIACGLIGAVITVIIALKGAAVS